jgi:hypothetical protein
MVRVGMSLYLMLVMAAGPWFCCCSFTRLAGWLLAPLPSTKTSPAAGAHACCRPHPVPDKSSKKPDRPHRPTCPCQERSSTSSALSVLESEIKRGDGERPKLDPSGSHLDLASSALSAIFPAGIIQVPCESAASHFLTARDMLRAHHVLRC